MAQRRLYKSHTLIGLGLLCFILLGGIVTAIPEGDIYAVKTVDECHGDIEVMIRTQGELNESEYMFVNCDHREETWFCKCSNPTTIGFLPFNGTRETYDIVLEWYRGSYEDDIEKENMRVTQWFKNIVVGPKPKPKEPFVIPEFKDGEIILIIVSAIILGIWILWLIVWRWVFADKDDIFRKKRKKEKRKLEADEVKDEELEEALREYTK